MHGKVEVWYMTEEERLSYIEKHPIIPTGSPGKLRSSVNHADFKWRGKKAAAQKKEWK